ncbi:MAG TPA: class I SAM-dependent methyltransferase [Candidatus Brocadiaceae bacterium]
MNYKFPNSGINYFVSKYLKKMSNLKGKVVVDIPAGDGRASFVIKNMGGVVKAFDLYPELFVVKETTCAYADLMEPLPIDDKSIDLVICQEGIEHLQDQIKFFVEFNRILKENGLLIITCPSISHFRARLSYFFIENYLWNKMPYSEIDAIRYSNSQCNKIYYGHIFLAGIQKLRTLGAIAGFKIKETRKTGLSKTSIVLGLFMYPIYALVNCVSALISILKCKKNNCEMKKKVYLEQLLLNISPKTVFCKHHFIVFKKERNVSENIEYLKLFNKK